MRRRWKRRVIWTGLLLGLLVLAIPATVAQAAAALRPQKRSRYDIGLAG
jgi:hypothetical protein